MMMRFRFSIASLLLAVLVFGLAFDALRRPTNGWAFALLGLTLLLLLTSVLLAASRTGERRGFWLGFALFGWSYLIASLVPPIATRLPTSRALVALEAFLSNSTVVWEDDLVLTDVRSFDMDGRAPVFNTDPNVPGKWDVVVHQYPNPSPTSNFIKRLVGLPGPPNGNFERIGHILLTLPFGLLGGFLSRRLSLASEVTGTPEAHDRRPSSILTPSTPDGSRP